MPPARLVTPLLRMATATVLGAATPLAAQVEPIDLPEVGWALPAPYLDPEDALRRVESMRRLDEDNVELHLIAAREATALGVYDTDREQRIGWLVHGAEAARQAVALDSLSAEATYWLAASLGLRADQEGGRTKITLARDAYDLAVLTLELDSLHGGAHHILGRLHAGAQRLGWATRLIARGLGLGRILSEASWESAEYHMRVAVAQDPDVLVNQYELGRLLVEAVGAPDEGMEILREVVAREPRHALDAFYIERASDFLASVEYDARARSTP